MYEKTVKELHTSPILFGTVSFIHRAWKFNLTPDAGGVLRPFCFHFFFGSLSLPRVLAQAAPHATGPREFSRNSHNIVFQFAPYRDVPGTATDNNRVPHLSKHSRTHLPLLWGEVVLGKGMWKGGTCEVGTSRLLCQQANVSICFSWGKTATAKVARRQGLGAWGHAE